MIPTGHACYAGILLQDWNAAPIAVGAASVIAAATPDAPAAAPATAAAFATATIVAAPAIVPDASHDRQQQQQHLQQDIQHLLQTEERQLAQLMGRAATAVAALEVNGRATRAAAAAAMGLTPSAEVDSNTVRAFISNADESITEGDQTIEDIVWNTSPDLADAADRATAAEEGEGPEQQEIEIVEETVTLQQANKAVESLLQYMQDNSQVVGEESQQMFTMQLYRMQDRLKDVQFKSARQTSITAFFA